MVESPQRIWIEADDECPYFYEAHELHDVEQDVIEYTRSDLVAELAAENEWLRALMRKAHAVMRECGWQLAVGCEPQGDGILEAACTEIEADFADALSAARRALTGGKEDG